MTSVSIPNHATNGNPVYGAIRAYNRMRWKHPGLLPLVPGTGKIVARGGKLVVLLPPTSGGIACIALRPGSGSMAMATTTTIATATRLRPRRDRASACRRH